MKASLTPPKRLVQPQAKIGKACMEYFDVGLETSKKENTSSNPES